MASTNRKTREAKHKVGLVLSGGGARGAYQAGVMRAIAEIADDIGLAQPFPIVTGISAGAINASFLAAHCADFSDAAERMSNAWSNITADRIFRTDALSAGRSGFRLLTDAAIGAFYRKKLARSLLDTAPLRDYLHEHVPFDRIAENVRQGALQALAITAIDYTDSTSVTWVHGRSDTGMWTRTRRISKEATISAEHVMASSAIPLFFPPVRVGNEHFGDGCLRNTAPLSPAIHLGADRIIVIGVRKPDVLTPTIAATVEPSIARVLGVVLNAVLLDAIEIDMERLSRINTTISMIDETHRSEMNLRQVDYLWLRPSTDMGLLAGELFHRLPSVIRYLIGGLGSSREASELTSYLLFDPDFCGELVRAGYADGLANAGEIAKFLLG